MGSPWISWCQAIAWVDEAIGIYRSISDDKGLACALARRGHFAFASGDAWPITLLAQARRWSGEESPEIRAMLEEGRRRFIDMGEVYGQVHADMILGTLYDQDLEYRTRHAEEMVRLGERPATNSPAGYRCGDEEPRAWPL